MGLIPESGWRRIDSDRNNNEDNRFCNEHVQGTWSRLPTGTSRVGVLVISVHGTCYMLGPLGEKNKFLEPSLVSLTA